MTDSKGLTHKLSPVTVKKMSAFRCRQFNTCIVIDTSNAEVLVIQKTPVNPAASFFHSSEAIM